MIACLGVSNSLSKELSRKPDFYKVGLISGAQG